MRELSLWALWLLNLCWIWDSAGGSADDFSSLWMSVAYSGGRRISKYLKEQRHCRRQKAHARTWLTSAETMESDKGGQGVFVVTRAIRLKTWRLP